MKPAHMTNRAWVQQFIAHFAKALDASAVRPSLEELRAILEICEELRLPAEAARVRRWLGFPEDANTPVMRD